MLIAGLVTVVITFLADYGIVAKLLIIFAVLAVFYFIGTIIANVIGRFEDQNQKIQEEEEKKEQEAQAEVLATEGNVEQKKNKR